MSDKRYWMAKDGYIGTYSDNEWRPIDLFEVLPVAVGSREWAVVMAMRGNSVWPVHWCTDGVRGMGVDGVLNTADIDEWYMLHTGPKRGDRVRWWRGDDSGTGRYVDDDSESGGHRVSIGDAREAMLWVERVEAL